MPQHGLLSFRLNDAIMAPWPIRRHAAPPRACHAAFRACVGSDIAVRIVSPTPERCMRLITKGLLLIAIPSLVELGLLVGVMRTQAEALEAEQWAVRSKEVLSQATAVLDPVLVDAVRMRGAVIDGYGQVWTPPSQWGEIDRRINRLIELVADNPLQVERAVQIRQSAQAYRQWSERSQELLRHGQQAGVVARFREFKGHDIVDYFRAQVAALQQEEMRLDSVRTERIAEARRMQQVLLVSAVIASIITGAIAVYVFTSSVRRRLRRLADNTKQLANNAPLAPMLEGDDEIAELDLALHQTSRRLLEAERIESRYRSDLAHQAEELGTMNEHLRERTQENEMFIYSVSHDLRAPLVNLQGFSQELSLACDSVREILARSTLTDTQRRRLSRIVDDDIAEALRFLQTAVMRSASIIDALLRLSRAGRVEYRPQQVDVQAVMSRVVDAMRDSIKSRGVTVKIHPLPSAWGDPTAVEQVFANLVSNAVNYLDPSRPGEIEIGTRPNPVGVHSLRIYYVRDNGYGIPASALPKLFTAFQRLHGGAVKGEGIGLALVRRVVERHGGNVWAESSEGIGSTFYLSLPESCSAHEALRAATLSALARVNAGPRAARSGRLRPGSGLEPGADASAQDRPSPTYSTFPV
ncbi:Sensory transduction protein kinase (EC 2.7.3.-) (plasmid) [Mycetohabitans rhizoxinica HKI 454]|uniref:histidine kinase n=2 Tax=Burkholderiaceae TaxID=119060 RepID=E5AUM6_MYCRK|nr:Sensory transduction protein kinase (EC 2.7.3.-) [Mycetohabitans rhizoxinica HKI 454]